MRLTINEAVKLTLYFFTFFLLLGTTDVFAKGAGSKRVTYLLRLNIAPELKKTLLEKRLKDQLTRKCHTIKDIDPGSLRINECHAYMLNAEKAPLMIYVEVKKPTKKGQWSYSMEISKREGSQSFKTVTRTAFDEPTKFMRDRGIKSLSEDEIVMVIRDRVIAFTFK